MNHDEKPSGSFLSALKRRRRVLLGGTVGLAVLGLAFGETIMRSDLVPAYAQNEQTQEDSLSQTDTMPEMNAGAPSSFAPIVRQVSPAVVSVRVSGSSEGPRMSRFERRGGPGGGGPEGGGPGGGPNWEEMIPGLPEDHPFNRWFRRFGEEDQQRRSPQPRQFGMAQGSGFFVSADGYLVTNNHVIASGQEIEITLDDGSSHTAEIVGTDERTDLALLKVDADREFAYVEFSEADPEVGDWMLAVGNPFGLGGSVTAGIISARGRDIGAGPYDDFIQIDAPINRGNSGGPTFNLEGEVIGVNTAIFSPSGGNVGIGFAIPAEVAARVVAELRDTGEVTRGWLGVSIQPVSADIAEALSLADARGALVNEPQPDGPAADAGLQSGDVILSVNGREISDARDLSRRIASLQPGSTAEIEIVRDGETSTIEVELGRMENEEQREARIGPGMEEPEPADTDLSAFGLSLAPAGSVGGAGENGVVVTEVEANGPAAERGVQPGDVILEVGGEPVATPEDVAGALSQAREAGRTAVLMRVQSGEQSRFLAMALPEGE